MEIKLKEGLSENILSMKRLGVTKAYKTLVIYIAPEGQQKEEIKYLTKKIETWAAHINVNNLFPWKTKKSYSQVLIPEITYLTPCLSLTEKE